MIMLKRNYFTLILIFAFLFRFLSINSHEYWFDEKASVYVAGQPLPMLLELSRKDTHPPLYFILLKAWSTVSNRVAYLRLLSVLSGTATIGLTYLLGKQIFNEKTAILTSVLMTLSPLHVYYSTEIRMYTLFVFEGALLTLLILKAQTRLSSPVTGLIIFIETALLYTHYYAIFLIIGLSVWCFLKKSRLNKWLFKLHLTSVLFFVPWLLYSLGFEKPGCWCFSPLIGVPTYFASLAIGGLGLVTLKDYFNNFSLSMLLFFAVVAILVLGLFFAGLRRHATSLPAVLFLVPLFLTTLVGFFTATFSPRALIVGLPFYFMLVAQGILNQRPDVRKILLLLTPVLLASVMLLQSTSPFFAQIPPYKDYFHNEELPPME